jgi:hypothetical protein
MERRGRKGSSSARIEEMELATDRKNGGILFDRPKPTAGCSANGRRGFPKYLKLVTFSKDSLPVFMTVSRVQFTRHKYDASLSNRSAQHTKN